MDYDLTLWRVLGTRNKLSKKSSEDGINCHATKAVALGRPKVIPARPRALTVSRVCHSLGKRGKNRFRSWGSSGQRRLVGETVESGRNDVTDRHTYIFLPTNPKSQTCLEVSLSVLCSSAALGFVLRRLWVLFLVSSLGMDCCRRALL